MRPTALMYIDGPTLSILIQLVLGLAVFVLVGRFILARLRSRDEAPRRSSSGRRGQVTYGQGGANSARCAKLVLAGPCH